ncbi:MAG: DUF429 domain-containing protein [Acidimicrobiaceae bacterium]|nr:DUF429 domain-containing protein [Acidimicrobiaceae bacterium]
MRRWLLPTESSPTPPAYAAESRSSSGERRPECLDGLLDATVVAWTARRIVSGEAVCLGEGEFDATGYPMHIWV